MYMVSDYCEPIITKEQFEKATEMRKANLRVDRQPGYVPQHDCFKGMIHCGQCGSTYTKVSNGHRVYKSGVAEKVSYQCHKVRITRMKECRNKIQGRQALEDGFVKAYNTLRATIREKEQIPYHNEELANIESRIKQLLDKEKIFILMEAREQLTPIFQKEYDELLEELLALQERKRVIIRHNADIKMQDYNNMVCENCIEEIGELTKFDEKVFLTMTKDIKVMSKNRILYEFKNGYTADVEVIDYYIRKDEIGEVKIYVSI